MRCRACNQLLADYEGDLCGQCYNYDEPTELEADYEVDDNEADQTYTQHNQSMPKMQV